VPSFATNRRPNAAFVPGFRKGLNMLRGIV